MILSPVILLREQLISQDILEKYTAYHLNAAVNGLISEKNYLRDCCVLDSLSWMLSKCTCTENDKVLVGAMEVTNGQILALIDRVHHYQRESISLFIEAASSDGDAFSSTSGFQTLYREVTASPTKQHAVSVPSGFVLKNVYLNGLVIQSADWGYSSGVFTYRGEESLTIEDWFLLRFEK